MYVAGIMLLDFLFDIYMMIRFHLPCYRVIVIAHISAFILIFKLTGLTVQSAWN